MTNSDFVQVKNGIEDVLCRTADKRTLDHALIHALARAVWFLLRREESRIRKEMRVWLEEVNEG